MKNLKRISPSYSKRLFGFATAGVSLVAFGVHAQAQNIIQDDFTSAGSGSNYGTNMGADTASGVVGLVPDTADLPGGPWQHISGDSQYGGAKEYTGYRNGLENDGVYNQTVHVAAFNNSGAIGIPLAAYNTGSLTVSASLYATPNFIENVQQPLPVSGESMLLGFSATLNNAADYGMYPATFTGLAVMNLDGTLQEYVHGSTVGNPVPYTGSYSIYTPEALKYTINTATGAISNVSFGTSTTNYAADFGSPGTWATSYTANAEIGGNIYEGAKAVVGTYDLAAAGAVPEPGTYAMLAAGALSLGAYQYRRRPRA